MDIGHFYSTPTDRHSPQSQILTNGKPNPKGKATAKAKPSAGSVKTTRKTMVDNKGWRKKIGGKQKEVPSTKTDLDDTSATPPTEALSAVDAIDKRRHGWRKTIAVSRPSTPLITAPSTPTPDEAEDTRSERSEASTPRRDSKPKATRYTSIFATHKEEPIDSIFSEPWSLDNPLSQVAAWSYVDPIVTMASIHSHMCRNYTVPVPLEYNSGLFQVFEDYRKLRAHKERLEASERSAIDHSRKVTAQWHQSEIRYEAEIRRLEILIARGTTGIDGLMEARRETVVDGKRQHRKTISTDRVSLQYKDMSPVELDDEIKSKTQQVILHRPSSPSEKMVALSRQMTRVRVPDTSVVPPHITEESVLSRKVKSELNLTDLRQTDTPIATSSATIPQLASTSGFEIRVSSQVEHLERDPHECEVFVALKELGILVARRKGLEVSRFVDGLMTLLTCADSCQDIIGPPTYHLQENEVTIADGCNYLAEDVTPRPPSRKPRSLSYPEHDHTHRCHFSFETGDDQMRELDASLHSYDALSQSDSTDSRFSSSSAFRLFNDGLETDDDDTTRLLASTSGELPKPTMIPSPVQTVGRLRRENSISSLQSVFVKNVQDDRHNSRTSIQTAFQEGAGAIASIKPKSRSSSSQNVHAAESPLGSRERLNSLANRQSNAALAAARAAEARSNDPSRSDTRPSTATSSSRKRRTAGQQRAENTNPKPHNNAGKKGVE